MEKLIDKSIKNIIYLYLIILPWLVAPHKAYYTEDEKLLFPLNTEGVYDIFLYWKMVFTIAVSIILLVLLIVSVIKYNYKMFDCSRLYDKIILICTIIYVVCTVVSYICTQYSNLALTGGVNSFEGTLVLLSYVVLFLAGRYVVQKCDYHNIEYIAMFNAVVLFMLSMIEVNYKSIAEIATGHTVEINYTNMLCLTFYNPAYCAGFIIILLPVCLYYYSVSKKLIKNVVWGCLSVTTLMSGFLTRSSAAFYILIFEVTVFVVVMAVKFIKNIRKMSSVSDIGKNIDNHINNVNDNVNINSNDNSNNVRGNVNANSNDNNNNVNGNISINFNDNSACRKIISGKIIGIATAIIAVLLIDMCAGGHIFNSAKSASVNETTAIHRSDYYKVNNIELNKNEVCITGDNNKLICGIDSDNTIYFTDEAGQIISVSSQGDRLTFPEPYSMVQAYIQNDTLRLDLGYKGELRFLMYDNNFYPVLSDGSVVKDISSRTDTQTARFDNLFTGRGYIWRNTLPILKNTLIFGHGAGTFEMYFKQFDFVGLLNSQGNVDLIIDKPHSLYLQIACNQGVLCSVAVLVILLVVIIANVQAVIRKSKGQASNVQTFIGKSERQASNIQSVMRKSKGQASNVHAVIRKSERQVSNIQSVIRKSNDKTSLEKCSDITADRHIDKSGNNIALNKNCYNNVCVNIFAVLLIAAFMTFELITDSNITVNPIFVIVTGMIGAGIKYEIR